MYRIMMIEEDWRKPEELESENNSTLRRPQLPPFRETYLIRAVTRWHLFSSIFKKWEENKCTLLYSFQNRGGEKKVVKASQGYRLVRAKGRQIQWVKRGDRGDGSAWDSLTSQRTATSSAA